ncbi:hypothetical protein BGZ83_000297 [Gryganskiella cystojenkinii]|nr:hypothetical protein BGZ83_000297 [Gryganskiella cystojenkinii]
MASLSIATKALWSLKASTRTVVLTGLSSQRLFIHSTSAAWEDKDATTPNDTNEAASTEASTTEAAADNEEEDEQQGDTKLPFRRRNFHKWLRSEGARFATPSFHGPNYVDEVPFPMNPLFKPSPPISNATKEEIYKLHMSDSSKHTPRQLGSKYSISIKRVEAILRLKHLEKELISEGFIPQEKFTRGMEQLMGVKDQRSVTIVEPLVDILPQVGSPKFEAVDEDQTFTAVDAAKVLKRRPLAEIKANMLEDEKNNPFVLKDSIKGVVQKTPLPTKPVSRNSAEANPRFKFTFMDTSKNQKGTLIREKDGTLLRVQQ